MDWPGDAADAWGGEESGIERVDIAECEGGWETEGMGERGHYLRVVLFTRLAKEIGQGGENSVPSGMKTLRSSAMVSDFSLSKKTSQKLQLEGLGKCSG